MLAREIARVRLDALEVHQPDKGDNAWSLGCLCYVRTCAALSKFEASGQHPWLRVHLEGLAFTMVIDGEPLKFYTGDPKRPKDRARHGLEQAIAQGRLPFMEAEFATTADGWFWLMAIETHNDGSVARIAVILTNRNGDIRETWYVPLEGEIAVATTITEQRREGVDLAPPSVGPKPVKTDTTDEGGA